MANPLVQSHRSALSMNDQIGKLFASAGTQAHPRGFVTTGYRNAIRAMKTALKESDPLAGARDVFDGLRKSLRSEVTGLLLDAQGLGTEEAARQLAYYGVPTRPSANYSDRVAMQAALDAIIARVDAQEAATRALILTGAEFVQVTGDDERAGTMRDSDIAAQVSTWAATLLWWSFGRWVGANKGDFQFSKIAVAAIDNRTTKCCLRVHGQIQPIDGMFELKGTPRYADKMDWSPFHGYCRTSIALYLPGFDDGFTLDMRERAKIILAEKENGNQSEA